MTAKDIKFGGDARDRMMRGVDLLANAVKTQERVIELAAGTQMEADPGLKKRLKQYKKALDASQEKENGDTPSAKSKR